MSDRALYPSSPMMVAEGASLAQQLLRGVTDEGVSDALGFREEAFAMGPPVVAATPLPTDWRSTISQAGYDFIVRWETGGKAYYEQVIKGRPVWPGYASGITIGCGWDLGYHTLADFQAQWGPKLAPADFERLKTVIGFKTVEPDRDTKVQQAQALVRSFSDIVVPWDVAIDQFDNVKYPEIIRQLYAALDHLDRIHPHCRGALLSLTFNRGPAFAAPGPRFSEMRDIAAAMRSGQIDDFRRIPDLFRSMKRIWGPTSSLSDRREGEAKLFESGLSEMALVAQVAGHAAAHADIMVTAAAAGPRETMADVSGPQTDIADETELADVVAQDQIVLGAPITENSVIWNPKDDEQPDYRHLDTSLARTSFDLTGDDLDALIKANEFAPLPGKMVFALRGASLGGVAKREGVSSVPITDQRPDHRNFRCVIGVYDPTTKLMSAYQASTVPNAHYVFTCFQMFKNGTPIGSLTGNILPTGCYTYTVGTHHAGGPGEIPTVLRLAQTADSASNAVVLRSVNDVIYDRTDRFVTTAPADNIHPCQRAHGGFSSAGCLTLPGMFTGGQHTGIWADFRAALAIGPNGTQYSAMLLTGLDAALAVQVRLGHRQPAEITRLRHGSVSTRVTALQTVLGLSSPNTTMGPATRQALVARQANKLGWADGIYSPEMDQLLGLTIYATS
jgi:hypothetical protein